MRLIQPTSFPGAHWIEVRKLRLLHAEAVIGRRRDLERLSDAELLRSVTHPRRGDPILIDSRSGLVVNGNSRARELLRRSRRERGGIRPETLAPYLPYTRDDSAFPDLPAT